MPRRSGDAGAGSAGGDRAGGQEALPGELEAARRECDRLRRAVEHARTTAHDLAQPLTTVLARSQMLLRKRGPDDPDHRALTIICQEAERLVSIAERFRKLKELMEDPEHRDPPPASSRGTDPRSS